MTAPTRPRFLVTAGNTRERIDAVRDWGNIFTGNTGFAIAQALSALGEVDLLTSNLAHLADLSSPATADRHPIHGSAFRTHADLKAALSSAMSAHRYEAVFMTAAVSDYAPARVFAVVERRPRPGGGEEWVVADAQAEKVKSHHARIAVLGEPTEKLVDLFRTAWGHQGLLVKFKLEVGVSREELLRIGEASRRASGADYLVANALHMVEGPAAGAYLLGDAGAEWVPRAALATRLADLVRVAQG